MNAVWFIVGVFTGMILQLAMCIIARDAMKTTDTHKDKSKTLINE